MARGGYAPKGSMVSQLRKAQSKFREDGPYERGGMPENEPIQAKMKGRGKKRKRVRRPLMAE